MPDTLTVARENALIALLQAEEACWHYLVELAVRDIGPELAQHLDTSYCSINPGNVFPTAYTGAPINNCPPPLTCEKVCLVLRVPNSTEIVLQYSRRMMGNYKQLEWEAFPWTNQGAGGMTWGKYAAVRYRLGGISADNIKVEPDGQHAWLFSDNVNSALVAAQKFYEEKQRLIQEAEAHIRAAIDNIGR